MRMKMFRHQLLASCAYNRFSCPCLVDPLSPGVIKALGLDK